MFGLPSGIDQLVPTPFRPPFAVAVREHASVLTMGKVLVPHLLPRPRTQVDDDRVPVLTVPGFLSGDWALRLMNDRLRALGHWTATSGIAPNMDCTLELVDALERRLEQITDERGSKVAVVGWSRGGTLGKLVTIRRPDLVAGLITLGTPNTDPLAVNDALAWQLRMLAKLRAAGVPGVLGEDCLSGECAARVREQLEGEFPADVPYVSVFSAGDGVIDWTACLDPDAETVEMDATHMTMGADADVIEYVASRLATLDPEPFGP